MHVCCLFHMTVAQNMTSEGLPNHLTHYSISTHPGIILGALFQTNPQGNPIRPWGHSPGQSNTGEGEGHRAEGGGCSTDSGDLPHCLCVLQRMGFYQKTCKDLTLQEHTICMDSGLPRASGQWALYHWEARGPGSRSSSTKINSGASDKLTLPVGPHICHLQQSVKTSDF